MESKVGISKLFDKLQDTLDTEIIVHTNATWEIPKISKDSTIGQQIKYYRRLANIKQEDLSTKLGYSRDALHHIENKEMKLVNINLIKDVIKELNIEDKININDDYIVFLLDNPSKKLSELRQKLGFSKTKLANSLNVSSTTIRRWEKGNNYMSRKIYDKIKKIMN